MWTYSEVYEADQAHGLADAQDTADAMNAETVTHTEQPFVYGTAVAVAMASASNDWARVVARSRMIPSLPPANSTDDAILYAITATSKPLTDVVTITSSDAMAFSAGLGTLVDSGDISSATANAIMALTVRVLPAWDPPVTDDDVLQAREYARMGTLVRIGPQWA